MSGTTRYARDLAGPNNTSIAQWASTASNGAVFKGPAHNTTVSYVNHINSNRPVGIHSEGSAHWSNEHMVTGVGWYLEFSLYYAIVHPVYTTPFGPIYIPITSTGTGLGTYAWCFFFKL